MIPLVVNKIIKDAFDADDDIPKELGDLINRLLELEDGDNTYSNKQDAIARLLEQRLEKMGLIDNEKFLKWCEEYEGQITS